MKPSNKFNLILFLFVTLFSFQLFSQDKEPQDQLFTIHEDIIKLDKVPQYEANVKKELELWKKHGMETTIQHASKFDNNCYYFLTALDSYGDLDKQDEYWSNFTKKAGKETVEELYKGYDGTYESHRNFIMKRSAKLSYRPANNRLKGEDAKFLHFYHYYFKEGKMDEGMKMMKEFKELMTKKQSDDAYTVWISDIGNEIGWVLVVRAAKNNVDYYQESNNRYESMADELKEMWPQFSKTLKRFDHNNGKPMPEFSYSPSK